jgi:serine/threonine protein kinase
MKNGGHKNIIGILKQGWLHGSLFFIDMELCELNLSDYIYRERPILVNALRSDQNGQPQDLAFIQEYEGPLARMVNVWTIMIHIASGLSFLHIHKQVHRDLNPKNGLSPHINLLTIFVLYTQRYGLWKITDFGISAEATSWRARGTQFSRGTSSYRAPELLTETPIFTNKVDIWGLGCILYELCVKKKAFGEDWNVQQYVRHPSLPFSSHLPNEWHSVVRACIQKLLQVEWQQRPRASVARYDFICHRQTCHSDDSNMIPHWVGLEIMGKPQVYSSFPLIVDIIFVHGFGGSAKGTWTHPKSRGFWPLWLSKHKGLEHTRVLAFGYDSDIAYAQQPNGNLSLDSLANQLLTDLASHYFDNGEVKLMSSLR